MRHEPVYVTEAERLEQESAIQKILELPERPKSFHIVTYGCQMNAHDSEKLAGLLSQMGMAEASDRRDADFVLFNTCCVRDNAERRALGNVTWLKELKKDKPALLIGVCGCMVQQPQMAQRILKQYRFIDLAFGTHNLHCLPSLLYNLLTQKSRVVSVTEQDTLIAEGLPVKRLNPYHAYITIMYGCDNFCSYCIVPYVRGRERSRKMADILAEAEGLLKSGVKEIMLLGQNVNSYGNGSEGKETFPKLLRALDQLGVPRIRFMTSHPKDLSDELIEAMADCKRVCNHLHLPVQSGNDEILRLMNRRYTRETYLRKVEKLRAAVPGIGLTTDLIVSFPGETESQFEDTCSLVREVGYDAAFTFIYSPREGTQAARMEGRIPEAESTRRIEKLIREVEASTARVHQSMIGSREQVLVEGLSKRDPKQVSGKGTRGITVTLDGTAGDTGKIIPVTITSAAVNTLRGERTER
ncbi:MAG: tRNA (N6-isopentenyl adenosine(37)-C2)-methylthiotransferase MiaB [Clostridiales bacterium]|nr:tRNA (N6-isopentenyl adenosine(37)-C2)-methylthiotransferase MiaB [Clostridiales bacterium]MDO4349904.1 tRNA (N6-isopentenyl adenosine(37)-C2)-methylthiotransferase MiaB [Eubacteriales bacterium]MDY4008370.1 tRNA (N6-isopentenyl adenosine(37)-C2)-methylthiotransferase MiaB [Candidatus Limiplasma sp.]